MVVRKWIAKSSWSDVRDPEWNMTLMTGTATPYNDSAIETDVLGFGIEPARCQRFANEPLSINATDFIDKAGRRYWSKRLMRC